MYVRRPDGSEVQLLDSVNIQVGRGETVGIIGESGSGKTMTALSVLRLLPENVRLEGEIRFDGVDLLELSTKKMRALRGSGVSMVFQDPMTALDPVFTIGQQISEVLRAHRPVSRRAARDEAIAMLEAVGVPDPVRRYGEYPHQLSGGMQQRAVIAMALVCQSSLLIADEPTTAVDITIQAQLLDLLRRLNREFGMAVLLITHDIGVVAEFCSRVAVMYAGQIVETCSTDNLLIRPRHPYAFGLMKAIPNTGSRGMRLHSIPGRVPRVGETVDGCRFHPRCEHVAPGCRQNLQVLRPVDAEHIVRCERAGELTLVGASAAPGPNQAGLPA